MGTTRSPCCVWRKLPKEAPAASVHSLEGFGEASRMLRDRYSVPVGGAECVPEWLTANVRPGGAPPDGKSLNLELARLDLSCLGDRS